MRRAAARHATTAGYGNGSAGRAGRDFGAIPLAVRPAPRAAGDAPPRALADPV
jgi:hypothetical protein